MAGLYVLRVFTDERGRHGNPLGVFLDGAEVPEGERQGIATELGFAETVFVDDPARGVIRIFTPAMELPFAGHPAVGTAWLLAREREPVPVLRPPAGELDVRTTADLTWIGGRAEWSPDFDYIELPTPADVAGIGGRHSDSEVAYVWAWEDEGTGTILARGLLPGYGVPEDEATGSAVLALCASLGRPIEVSQGEGSIIHARPLGEGRAEIGGRVVLDERRER